jgi:NTE family protein
MEEAIMPALESEEAPRLPEEGIGLCLSGGGYRAMLFHVGVVWRLNEIGYLAKIDRISSVSGGSITAGYLGFKWRELGIGADGTAAQFVRAFVSPIRALARHTIDVGAALWGLLPGAAAASRVAKAYRKHLFGDATLQGLPAEPRFVINATSVQSAVLWRFSRRYEWDYRVGRIDDPRVPLAEAVAASSAFPPVLSPLTLRLDPRGFAPATGTDLQVEPYTSEAVLSDGGVYDNLGLETVFKRYTTVLASDAGGVTPAEPSPKRDWIRHSVRVLEVIDRQVRSLRKRQLIDAYEARDRLLAAGARPDSELVRELSRQGAFWGIRTNIADYGLPDALPCPHHKTLVLASVKTRLARIPDEIQERLINWGYAITDAAMRRYVDHTLPRPGGFPFPDQGVG